MGSQYADKDLESLKRLVKESSNSTVDDDSGIKESRSLNELFFDELKSNNLKTMAISYDVNTRVMNMQIIKDNLQSVNYSEKQWIMSREDYDRFCSDSMMIDLDAKYNDSTNLSMNGVKARVFAIMPPYTKTPVVVISTPKVPPKSIPHLSSDMEELLGRLMGENTIIIGKSGSGKTYLLNYLLSKYSPKNKRFGIFQEFEEIYPPNQFTDFLTVPPKKPDQTWSDLEFLTEMSNLMRYDTLIVGEIKGAESWPFVQNLASGTKGLATLHGDSIQNGLQRLRTLCLLSKPNLSEQTVTSLISKAVDYCVYVDDTIVKDVSKLVMSNKNNFTLEQISSVNDL